LKIVCAGVGFKDIAGLDLTLEEVLEVRLRGFHLC
jgi:hypothetical protein